jgi:hypothetical protein
MLVGLRVGVVAVAVLGLPCLKPERGAGEDEPEVLADIGVFVIELMSTSSPSAFFNTTLDRVPGTKAEELALSRPVAVEGVGGGEVMLMLLEAEWVWECGRGG